MMRPDNDKQLEDQQNRNEQDQLGQGQARQDQDAPNGAEPLPTGRRQAAPVMPAAPSVVSATPEVCARLSPDLKAYQDGQMEWRQKWSVGRHLKQCAACREELEAMREFSDKWRGADAEVLDPGLRARILAAVPDTRPAAPARSAPSRLRSRPLLLAGAGAGVSVVVGAIVLYPVLTKNSGIAPPSAAVASAGKAQNRIESYAAAPAASSGSVAAMPAAPVIGANSAAANPAGTQIADARQFPADKSGGAPGDLERTARDGNINGNTSGLNANDGAEAAATGGASPPASTATTEAAGSVAAAPAMSKAANGSQATSSATSKVSAPPSPPTPAPSTATASSQSHQDGRQAATSVQPRPAPERSLSNPKKAVHPAQVADGLPADKAAMNRNVAGEAAGAGDAAKTSVSPHAAPASAGPLMARRAGNTQANRMQTNADTQDVTLKIRVERAETAVADIERQAHATGVTVVVSETTTNADGAKSATLKLKVPTADLDAFLAQSARTGTVLSQSMSAARSTASAAAPHANSMAYQARSGSQKQTAYTNVTVLLQGR